MLGGGSDLAKRDLPPELSAALRLAWALAARLGAEAGDPGEVPHDQRLTAQALGRTLVDGGHYATEAPVLTKLQEKLQEAFPGVEFLLAQAGKDPAKTL